MKSEQSFRSLVRGSFEFLESTFRYPAPVDESVSLASMATYHSSDLEICVQLDHRDRLVTVDFEVPAAERSGGAPQIRIELGEVLAMRAPWEYEHRRVLTSASDTEAIKHRLDVVAEFVRLFCSDILEGSLALPKHLRERR